MLAVKELNRGFALQAGFANKFGGCVRIMTTTNWRLHFGNLPSHLHSITLSPLGTQSCPRRIVPSAVYTLFYSSRSVERSTAIYLLHHPGDGFELFMRWMCGVSRWLSFDLRGILYTMLILAYWPSLDFTYHGFKCRSNYAKSLQTFSH